MVELTKDYYVVHFHTLPRHICSAFHAVNRGMDDLPNQGEVRYLDWYTYIDPDDFVEGDFEEPDNITIFRISLQTIKTYFEGYDPNEVLIWFEW